MGHGIETLTVNGVEVVEAIYNRKPAWHSLGKVWLPSQTEEKLTRDIVLREGHIDWPVTKKQVMFDDGTGTLVPFEGRYVTMRENPTMGLGIVGERYTVMQNRDCFEFLDSLVESNQLEYESAFALHGGKQVAILARLPSYDAITDDDISLRHILMLNSHDGSGVIRLVPTSTRVVCANTVAVALRRDANLIWNIRHTASLKSQLLSAGQYLSQFDEMFTEFADEGRMLASKKVSEAQRKEYLSTLFPKPTKENGEPAGELALHRWEEKTDHINTLFRNGRRNNLKSIKGTWWSLFNAVTEYTDHYAEFRGDNAPSNRVESIFHGVHSALKKEAFNLAVAMA